MASELGEGHVVPTVLRCVGHFGLLPTFQPQGGDDFTISVGGVAQYIANFFADVITGNPSVAFGADALPHAVHQDGVVAAGSAVAEHAVYIGELNVVAAAIEDGLTAVEGIKCVLIGQSVRCRTVRTAAETPHGVAAYAIPIGLERGQAGFGEHPSARQVSQSRAFGQGFVTLQAEPSQVARFIQQGFLHIVRLYFERAAHEVGGIRVAQ